MLKIRAEKVWIKSLHTLAYLIYIFFTKTWGKEYIINPSGKIVEHYTTKWMKKLGKIWFLIEFISILPWIILKVEIPSKWKTIICDRYIPDFLATTALRTGDLLTPWKTITGKFLLNYMKKTKIFLLNIKIKTLLKRRPNIEYREKEIKTLIALYKTIVKDINTCTINTDKQTPKETIQIILQKLGVRNESNNKNN